jgi:hypothetical protein
VGLEIRLWGLFSFLATSCRMAFSFAALAASSRFARLEASPITFCKFANRPGFFFWVLRRVSVRLSDFLGTEVLCAAVLLWEAGFRFAAVLPGRRWALDAGTEPFLVFPV